MELVVYSEGEGKSPCSLFRTCHKLVRLYECAKGLNGSLTINATMEESEPKLEIG